MEKSMTHLSGVCHFCGEKKEEHCEMISNAPDMEGRCPDYFPGTNYRRGWGIDKFEDSGQKRLEDNAGELLKEVEQLNTEINEDVYSELPTHAQIQLDRVIKVITKIYSK